MFRAVPLPIIRSFPLYIRHWFMSCRFDDSFQARPGWNYMFRAVPLLIIRSFPTVHSTLVYFMLIWWQLSSRTRMELSSILVVLESCNQTCMTYTSAECTVENSWWWAEELPETCRVSWQNKFGQLVRLLLLLKRNLLRCMVTWTSRAPVSPSVPMEQLGFHRTDFHEIWYLSIFRKSVERIQFSLKPDKDTRYFTWRRMHFYDNILLSS